MKFKKIISSGLALGLIFNNISLSLAGVISKDGRYETFEGDNIIIDNILEQDKADVEIEGSTLVNLVSIPSKKSLTFTATKERATLLADFTNRYNIKPNTEYTYFVEIQVTDATDNLASTVGMDYIVSEGVHKYHSTGYASEKAIKGNGQSLFKVNFTTGNEVSHFNNLYIASTTLDGNVASGTHEILNAIMVEGNYIDKDLSYFEGIKSVGELEENKIEISSQNENLFKGEFERGGTVYGSNLGMPYKDMKTVSSTRIRLKDLMEVKEGAVYTLKLFDAKSLNLNFGFQFFDKNKNGMNIEPPRTSTFMKYKVPDGAKYVNIFIGTIDDSNININDLAELKCMLVMSNEEPTYYVEPMLSKKEIMLNEPLRGLPNGVKDRIIKKNSQWMVERNVDEIVLNGDEEYNIYSHGVNDKYMCFTSVENYGAKKNADTLTDRFIKDINIWETSSNNEGLYIGNVNHCIFVKILKSRLDTLDVSGFKQWLKNNPTTVVYELEIPTYEPLNTDSTLNLYLDMTYISNNSNIPANMKITIDRTVNRATEAIQIAEENPTIENISQARYWANLMKETIKKDEVNNQINDITTPVDLNIEKKTASANIDVYVKSDNSLSMTLSTNSITFDKYTGADDIEKNNALEITVHSSLPYDLNVYLEENIQNSDKSVVMDSNLLQIKESTDIDYKSFINTKDKIILAENNSYGNYKKHNIDLKIEGSNAYKADVYKTTIKFEAEQK